MLGNDIGRFLEADNQVIQLLDCIISSGTRLQGYATWELITFLLNGLIFILIGLQLRNVVEGLSEYTTGELVFYAVLVSLTAIFVRLL